MSWGQVNEVAEIDELFSSHYVGAGFQWRATNRGSDIRKTSWESSFMGSLQHTYIYI